MIADRAARHVELAGLHDLGPLRVAEVVQPVDQLAVGQRLPAPQLERTRKDARKHGVALAVQPRVDEPAKVTE